MICSFVLVCILGICLPIIIKNKNKTVSIEMTTWYESEESEAIINLSHKSVSYSLPYSWTAYIHNFNNKDIEIVKKSENYVGESSIYLDGFLHEGQLYFKNNSYYLFYQVDDTYCVRNLLCEFYYEDLIFCFPLPAAMIVNLNWSPYMGDFVEMFFENNSFAYCKEFYSLLNDYVRIDEKTEKIFLQGNDLTTQTKYEVVLDFSTKEMLVVINNETNVLYQCK